MHQATRRFVDALNQCNIDVEVTTWPEGTRTAADAARAVGTTIDRIVKSLVFRVGNDSFTLVLVSGDRIANLERLSAALGASVSKASAKQVKAVTGSSIGGVAPCGHPAPMQTLIDDAILRHDTVWVAAGAPGVVCEIPTAALLRGVSGKVAQISEPG